MKMQRSVENYNFLNIVMKIEIHLKEECMYRDGRKTGLYEETFYVI
jgi:hypothetical protein